jgi:Mrp family chromosome partitioning ATPase
MKPMQHLRHSMSPATTSAMAATAQDACGSGQIIGVDKGADLTRFQPDPQPAPGAGMSPGALGVGDSGAPARKPASIVRVAHRFPIRATPHRDPEAYLLSPSRLLAPSFEDFVALRARLSERLTAPAGVLVASARHAEGRSITALTLSIALAQASARVVYVEADFRRPALNMFFNLPACGGLSALLSESAPIGNLGAYLLPTDIAGLDLLPAGVCASPAIPLDMPRLAELMGWLRAEADWIIVDSPPMLTYSDALPLLSLVDGVLITALVGRTREQDLAALATRLALIWPPVVATLYIGR